MCIVLKLDLGCCRGCREWVRRNLKRLEGVEQVEVREDEATLTVRGSGFDETEIMKKVRRRKGRSKVEVVSRTSGHGAVPLAADREAGRTSSGHACGAEPRQTAMEKMQKSEVEREPKQNPSLPQLKPTSPRTQALPFPSPPPAAILEGSEKQELQLQRGGSGKGETLVTERILPEFEGMKIRTRVTTSQDACTCIRVEETRFLIDRHRHKIPEVKHRCRALITVAKQVDALLSKLPPSEQPFGGQEVNASSLGWAMAAVSSRAFQVQSSDIASGEPDRKQRVLLPLIDMCNHSFTPNARISQRGTKQGASFDVVTEHNLQEGTDILLSYGPLSNDLLLLDYGFVVPQNSHDYVEVRYDRSLLDAAGVAARLPANFLQPAEWQRSVLEQLNLEGPGASLQVKFGGPNLVDGRLLAALRVFYADDPDVLQGKDIGRLQSWESPPLGGAIESKVLKTAIGMCALLLGHFSTTITDDEATLQSKELSDARRLAAEYRIAKKKVLVGCVQGISQKLRSVG